MEEKNESDLRARIEAARARREASAQKEALEALARAAEHEEALAELEEAHGPCAPKGTKIAKIEVGGHVFVCKRGPEVLFKRFSREAEQAVARKKSLEDAAIDRFIGPCMIYPPNADELFAELPGAKYRVCGALQELYGIGKASEDEGK